MVFNTATVAAAVTPTVIETFLSHVDQSFLIPKLANNRSTPTANL